MDKYQEIITKSASETSSVGEKLGRTYLKFLKTGNHFEIPPIFLFGSLGAGKTTFSQGFAKGLGISRRLLSPTFIIVRRYLFFRKIYTFYHIDLYRINNEKDLHELGLSEIFSDPNSLIIVEWSEKMSTHLPNKRAEIIFSIQNNGNHKITISKIK